MLEFLTQLSIWQQYLLLGAAIAALIGIKISLAGRVYRKQTTTYMDPQIMLPDIQHKLKSLKNFDPRIILNQNLSLLKD